MVKVKAVICQQIHLGSLNVMQYAKISIAGLIA